MSGSGSMLVGEAADFLAGLARGGTLQVGSDAFVDAMIASGLARELPDQAGERARLEALQARMRSAASEDARRALRSEVLALSEALAMSSSGAIVVVPEGGAYRGGPTDQARRIALTQRGRAFAADYAPRAERAATLTAAQFETEMTDLRATLGERGRRAGSLATSLSRLATQPNPGAWRSAAIGLSACREDESAITRTFDEILRAYGARLAPWTLEQGISAAECMCLTAPSLADVQVNVWVPALLDERDRLLAGICANQPEHALDAAIVLASTPYGERTRWLAAATEMVRSSRSRSIPIALPTALICIATGLHTQATLEQGLAQFAPRLVGPDVDMAAATDALALGLASGAEPSAVVDRILAHRELLARFAPRASISAAALLAWIDAPLAETLDDLRLCASVVQTNRLAIDPGETAANAVKLLLVSALLGAGNEGDSEERLALGARAHARISRLGVGTIAATVPLLVGATAAFVQPLLDAAAIWDAQQRASQGYVHTGSHHHYYG